MKKRYLRFGELLMKEGLLTQEQLDKALAIQKKTPGEFIGAILRNMGIITERDLVLTLSKLLNIPAASREAGLLVPAKDQDLTKLIPEEFARNNHVLPLVRHGNILTVAFADPTNIVILDNLRIITGYEINRVIASITDIEAGISQLYGEGGMLKTAIEESYAVKEKEEEAAKENKQAEESLTLDGIVDNAGKAPVIKLTDLLIRQAVKTRASDIHIEPFQDRISIRFRIDGVLHEVPPPDKSTMLPIVSRFKILSRLDIAEKRLPQDGSFRATIDNRSIDFRVSTIPTVNGEKMVLRILDRGTVSLNLESLGFSPDELEAYRKVIRKPYGLILITGPTGSGKTTTLYGALNELRSGDKNITTIEDPVEYQMEGVNQVQVKSSIGLTFAAGLRAFLRQDPDIILVGETRDLETAQICVRAALTGHLVLSTLHTNDAPTAVSRLTDIGVEPFLVSSSLLMVIAQRLVRRLCPKCKERYTPAASRLPKNFNLTSGALYKPVGCDDCAHTGYSGRMAIFEMMTVNERLEELIAQKAATSAIRAEARKAGMKTLEEAGFWKVNKGETSLEEVLRVTLPSAAMS